MRFALALAMLTSVVLVPVLADDQGGGDDKLVGSWKLVSVHVSGTMQKLSDSPTDTLTFTKDGKLIYSKKGAAEGRKDTWKANPTATPPELDLIALEKGKAHTAKAIYRLQGKKLQILMADESDPGAVRPKEFEPKNGLLLTLEREAP